MASKKGISAPRLKAIYKRQHACKWDESYQPSILATPQEAPSISRAITLKPLKLGREVHLLSIPERNAALLGLYHPDVIGLQEQRMLSPEPAPHPLYTLESINRLNLPAFRGLVEVAESMGLLNQLPRVQVPLNSGEIVTTVFPWIGDLLWALKDKNEKIFCINWSVKDNEENFKRPTLKKLANYGRVNGNADLQPRHQIEQQYYLDAEIRTVFVSNEKIDQEVAANLRQLFLHHSREIDLNDEQKTEILNNFKIAFDLVIPPSDVITAFVRKGKYSVDQCRQVFYQAIWSRKLHVDLFSPILINLPMKPESRDVLEVYQDWFKGLS
ncbi:MAG: hypothetical protein CTY38_04805 [Methylotenera sp.]|uniref:hypothetical protein n=1 Tax=Methylotenera sp. TaxID=2051956 RepID=UPI000D4A6006|nr:hypothetical protein [Methylotenera sp.]PPC83157.1 MAG: hypothetical protein CTY38_04805 [Methylotenera sp.]